MSYIIMSVRVHSTLQKPHPCPSCGMIDISQDWFNGCLQASRYQTMNQFNCVIKGILPWNCSKCDISWLMKYNFWSCSQNCIYVVRTNDALEKKMNHKLSPLIIEANNSYWNFSMLGLKFMVVKGHRFCNCVKCTSQNSHAIHIHHIEKL